MIGVVLSRSWIEVIEVMKRGGVIIIINIFIWRCTEVAGAIKTWIYAIFPKTGDNPGTVNLRGPEL